MNLWLDKKFQTVLMWSNNSLSTSKDSVFSATFTGCPSTGTFYEVKLQQLLLHQWHNFQKWCRDSRLAASWSGQYYPPEGGRINRACLEEQKPASAVLRGVCFYFYFIYFFSFLSSAFFSPHSPIVLGKRKTMGTKLCLKIKQNSISLHCSSN